MKQLQKDYPTATRKMFTAYTIGGIGLIIALAIGGFALARVSHVANKAHDLGVSNTELIAQNREQSIRLRADEDRLAAEARARSKAICDSLRTGRKAILSTVVSLLEINPSPPLDRKQEILKATVTALTGKAGDTCGALQPSDIPVMG